MRRTVNVQAMCAGTPYVAATATDWSFSSLMKPHGARFSPKTSLAANVTFHRGENESRLPYP